MSTWDSNLRPNRVESASCLKLFKRLFMKKYLFGLLASVLVFGGCGGADFFRDEPEVIELSGILVEQSNTDPEVGTHFIVGDDEKVAARSVSLNLSNDKYLDNDVKARGVLNEDLDVFEITSVAVVEVLSTLEKSVSVKEYANSDLGFKIKYFSDWEFSDDSSSAVFTHENGDKLTIDQFAYSLPDDFVGSEIEYFLKNTKLVVDSTLSVTRSIGPDKLEAAFFEDDSSFSYFIYRNGFVYDIKYVVNRADIGDAKRVFNEMMAGFRFTGFTVDSEYFVELVAPVAESDADLSDFDLDLAVYESLPYFFRGKYPSDWYYSGERGDGEIVKHHYGFSDESVEEDNEIIGLDILVSDAPNAGKFSENGVISIYFSVSDQDYRIFGDASHEDLMQVMAGSIEPTQ